jgi:hypothetical protein
MLRKRWVRRALVGLLVAVAVTVVGLFADRHLTRRAGEKRYAVIVAHLDAADPRWRYDEIDADRGTLPDGENSTLLVPKFTAALAEPPFDRDPLLAVDYLSAVPPNCVLDDATYDALDAALVANADAVAVARRFEDYPRGLRRYALARNPIDTRLPEAQETRRVVRLLDLAAERSGRDGRGGTALGYVRPMVNVGRSLDGEPFMITALVRMACLKLAVTRVERTLALGTPRRQLPEIQSLLLREAESDLFWYGLRGDRAVMDRLFSNLRSGSLSIGDIGDQGSGTAGLEARFGHWRYHPHLAEDHATFLDIMTRAYEARALPEHEQRAALNQIVWEIKLLPPREFGSLLTRLLTPAFNKIHDAGLRAKAILRCAAAGVAVERFRLARGRWPATLGEIPKDLLPAVPLDPFGGQPLKYVKRDDGVTVYSIGPDEQDDGGTIRAKFTNEPGQDVGFRLYDPGRRGLPALPRLAIPEVFRLGPNGELEAVDDPRVEEGPEPREVGPQ